MSSYKLNDNSISHIAKIVQLAILSGTDIVDHLRMMELEVENKGNALKLNESYDKAFEENIKKMIDEVNNKANSLNEINQKETIFS